MLGGGPDGCGAGAGLGGAPTLTVIDLLTVPPPPVQLRLKLDVEVSEPVEALPLVGLDPLQAPLALQLVAFVELQLSVLLLP